ncbi:MAG: hypothetical protein AB8G14_07135 [Ilumatobacter sp.]
MLRSRTLALACSVALALSACSGGGDSTESSQDSTETDQASDADADADTGVDSSDDETNSDTLAVAPIEGAVVSVLDLGLGLYAIDPIDGANGELSYDDDWYTERDDQPIVTDGQAYTIVFRPLEGETFSNDIALAAFDLSNGVGREVVALGVDRDSDESTSTTQFTLMGVGGTAAWVRITDSPGDGTSTRRYVAHSTTTGAEIGEYSPEEVELTTENGSSCSFTPDPVAVDTDGALLVDFGGLPARFDPTGTELDVLLDPCFNADVTPLTLLEGNVDDFVVTSDGAPLPVAAADRLLDFTPEIATGSIAVDDTSIWWLFTRTSGFSDGEIDVSAIIGGFARYDRASGTMSLFGAGAAAGEFLDPEVNDGFTQTALTDADLQLLDGQLWIMDVRDDQPLRRLDPDTALLEEFVIPLEAIDGDDGPVDFVSARLLRTDPDGVWLTVSRRTIQLDDDSGRTTTGAQFIDQVDAATGDVIRSVSEGALTGFEI